MCNIVIRKSYRFLRYVEKYGTARQITDDTWRMRIAYWIPKVTNAHSEYVLFMAFPLQ